uniref:Alpha-2-macroglobulin-like n=1 Tax=Astyanax mexicanus TaxID=7994 RepID=A0A8B9KDH6_ASTMX
MFAEICTWAETLCWFHGQCLKLLLLVFSYFMVTFPAVIESGSEAKLCVSLLKPNETLQLTVYLLHKKQNRTLLQERVEEEFHRCSQFKAPKIKGQSVQEIRVEVKGENFLMTETRKVVFKSYKPLTFIQTDKPIYNPGQKGTFSFLIIKLINVCIFCGTTKDNNKNRIGQWTNVSSTGLILQLSHQLNSEASEGQYTLKAIIEDRWITHHFTVKKYVLPKFEVTLKAPKEHSVGEEELKIEVCGKYTFGQPVPGTALVQVCRKSRQRYFQGVPCLYETLTVENGCASHIYNMSVFIGSEFAHNFRESLDIDVTMTEEGTGISMVKSGRTEFTFVLGKAEFLDLPKHFERDTVIQGKIKVTTHSGKPIPNKEVYLLNGYSWQSKLLLNLTTDDNGLASFTIDAPADPDTEIRLLVWYDKKPQFEYREARIPLIQPVTPYSPVYSELIIESIKEPITCDSEVTINVKYYIVGETTDNYSTDLIYMVLSKGVIVHHGYEKVEVKDSRKVLEGSVSFKLSVIPEMAPVVQVLVYGVLPSENVIAASKNFNVEKCFTNKVSLQFSPSEAVPGEENSLQLSALPGSLCALSAVDQSVFILEPGKRLDPDTVFNLLPVKLVSDYARDAEDAQECWNVWARRQRQTRQDHVYNTIKSVGLKMATNLVIKAPHCLVYKGERFHRRYWEHFDRLYKTARVSSSRHSPHGANVIMERREEFVETVRNVFPETWIWQLAEVGDSGSAQVPVTVPDTITTWEMDTFCLSSRGVGVAPAAQLRVFQPFFLELSLPYSIIRGEEFELKATVFNYLSKCIMVKVTPAPSSDYTLKASSSDEQYSSCLCANGRKTFRWTLVPSVLGVLNVTVSAAAEPSQTVCDNEIVSVPDRGRIDTVTRSLLVQAEGTEKSKSQSWLLCPQGNSVSEELELTLPGDVIEGSAQASVSVLGDILGRALQNIDGLLKMPYGCGEQNIALLSPNIYILQYLESTEQLTPAIREKATGFLKSGYQRQLNYKHYNGAYSTFGTGQGNTWLTAFVMRTFGKAQRYIFIDPENINSAKKWLLENQTPDGCALSINVYFSNSSKEKGCRYDPVVSKGLSCIKSSIGDLKHLKHTYASALLAYTFSLAGENEIRGQLLKKLDTVAIVGDGRLHWSRSATEDSDSLSVEISSYVLLAALSTDELSAADLGYANRIVSWLVRQQNPYGGFSSTQDTVVALQALALYSTKVYSSNGSSTVTVQSADKETHSFEVNQNNKLLYQEKSLQNVPGKYSVSVNGSTCASVQVSETHVAKNSCMATTVHSLFYLYFRYNGKLNSTNMVIVDIKILSGFTGDPNEVSISGVPVHYQLHIKQVLPVKNLKPAVIKVYDYYQPSDQSETEYSSPCV